MQPMILSEEQEAAVQMMLRPESRGAALDGSDMGTGKTAVATEFCKRINAKVILIIAPAQTLGAPDEGGWHGTFVQQQVPLKFRQIDSSVSGKKAHADFQWSVPGVYWVSHQMFVLMGWDKVPVMITKDRPKVDKDGKQVYKKVRTNAWHTKSDVVIFDEVHRAQNGSSATVKTLMPGPGGDTGVDATFKIGASGTWYGNSFGGAWAVTRWLWPSIIDASPYVWNAKWAEIKYDPFAVRNQKVVGELVPGAFVASLPCYIRIESDLNLEIDEKDILVDISSEQRRVYNELENQNVAWIENHPMVTKFPITRRIRQRQATLGMPTLTKVWNAKTNEYDTHVGFDLECESAKIDRMWSILEDDFDNETALIFTDSEIFATVLAHRLNKRYGEDTARKWSGKVTRAKRNADKQDYIKGDYKYMVAVIKSSGTGLDGLQFASRNILYMSQDDSGIENIQSGARLVRQGQESDLVRIRRLLAMSTIDQGQNSSLVESALRRNRSMKR